jgi:hypothetical protein
MRTIYESAQTVVAWIGEENNDSDRAIETLMQVRMQALKPQTWPDGLKAIHQSWAGRLIPASEDSSWDAISHLFQREWFRRVWIIQELVSATSATLICGSWSVNWDDIFEALKICRETIHAEAESKSSSKDWRLLRTDAAYDLGLTREIYKRFLFKHHHSLLSLLELFSYARATRECDRLFALLGLASDAEGEEFLPDYDSSLEVVVRRYASAFVKRGDAMELLYRSGVAKSYKFASWIPYWTREEFPQTISTWYSAEGEFSASRDRPISLHFLPEDAKVLVISGISVDKIKRMGIVTTKKTDVISFVNSLRTDIESLKSYPTGESIEEVKLKLPIGNASHPHVEKTRELLLSDKFAPVDEAIPRHEDPFDFSGDMAKVTSMPSVQAMVSFLKQNPSLRDHVWNYWHTVTVFSNRISEATFCVSERGYAGLVPAGAAVGDSICVLHGGKVPFVLRETSRKGVFKMIGECYIHGLMYGEALELQETAKMSFRLV